MKSPHNANMTKAKSLAVIGGGAAGFFAAINAAQKAPNLAVTVFEAGNKPLQKVSISGGGRCNLTHACFDSRLLLQHYPRGQKELPSVFSRFQPGDTVSWFEQRGVRLKTEADGRIFPISDCSGEVIDCLRRQAMGARVQLLCGQRVGAIVQHAHQFKVHDRLFDFVLLATGYSPPGWQLAAALGHTILAPVPSLFPFKLAETFLHGLPGLSLPDVVGRLRMGKQHVEARGPLLITHTGVSGPVVYRLSAWGARALAESGYQATLTIDWLPDHHEDALREQLTQQFQGSDKQKKLGNTQHPHFPQRLWQALLQEAEADLETQAAHLPRKTLNKLVERLKRSEFQLIGRSPSKEEFVSCGGVDCREVNFKTMESKICPGLYFSGEILNIDGLTGGFNFQAAWSTAWVASEALAIGI